jgi:hypothetical protein
MCSRKKRVSIKKFSGVGLTDRFDLKNAPDDESSDAYYYEYQAYH